MNAETKVTIRAKAFSNEGVRTHKCLVSDDRTVRVWDSVAGHYTTCHRLTPAAIKRAREASGMAS